MLADDIWLRNAQRSAIFVKLNESIMIMISFFQVYVL